PTETGVRDLRDRSLTRNTDVRHELVRVRHSERLTDVDHLVQRLAKHLLVLIDLVAVLLLIPELGLLRLQLVPQRPDPIHLTTERSLLALVPGLVVLDLKLLTPQFELSE